MRVYGSTDMATERHGMSKSSEFEAWHSMKQRCSNPNYKNYKWYGGRGIRVCDRWLNSFTDFYGDMGKRPSNKYSLDRIDVNGNYEPDNCKWSTAKEQHNNKRTNKVIEVNGRTQTIQQWCDELGINSHTVYKRLSRGWLTERALTI